MYIKERPNIREGINKFCKKHNITILDMFVDVPCSSSIKKQLKKMLLFGIFTDNLDNWTWKIFCDDYSVDSALEITRMINHAASQIIESIQTADDETSIDINIAGKSPRQGCLSS